MSRIHRPPYIDPTTQIIYDTDHPDVEGYLTKQSMWLKDWRRRYFLLKGSKLFFAKNDYSAPHGMIDLSTCTTVKSADIKSKKINSFEISTPEITYLLYADTEKEKDDWIGSVGRAIVRCSSTYYRGNSNIQNNNNNHNHNNANNGTTGGGGQHHQQQHHANNNTPNRDYGEPPDDDDDDDDDIYENDPNNPNPYFND